MLDVLFDSPLVIGAGLAVVYVVSACSRIVKGCKTFRIVGDSNCPTHDSLASMEFRGISSLSGRPLCVALHLDVLVDLSLKQPHGAADE